MHGAGTARRIKVKSQCLEKGPPDCIFMDLHIQQHHGTLAFDTALYGRLVSLMLNATFCLEPDGDTPSRKGLIDAIVLGCIPVLFLPAQRKLWPWHLPDWSTFSVLLDPHSDNAVTQLQKIPPGKVARLRKQLARVARGLSYEIHEGTGDVVERSLRNAWRLTGSPLLSDLPSPGGPPEQRSTPKAGTTGAGRFSKPGTTQDSIHKSLPSAGLLQQVLSLLGTRWSFLVVFFVSILCSVMFMARCRPTERKFETPWQSEQPFPVRAVHVHYRHLGRSNLIMTR